MPGLTPVSHHHHLSWSLCCHATYFSRR